MSRVIIPATLEKLQANEYLTALVDLDQQKRDLPDSRHWGPVSREEYFTHLKIILDEPSVVLGQAMRPGGMGFIQPLVTPDDGTSTDTRTTLHMGLLLALLQHSYKRERELYPMRAALSPLLPLLLNKDIGIGEVLSAATQFGAFRQTLVDFADSLNGKPAVTEMQAVMVRVILNILRAAQTDIDALGRLARFGVNRIADLPPLIVSYQNLSRVPLAVTPVAEPDAARVTEVESKAGGASGAAPALPPVPAAALTHEAPPAAPTPTLPPVPTAMPAPERVPRTDRLVDEIWRYIRARTQNNKNKHLYSRVALFKRQGFSKNVKLGAARELINALRGKDEPFLLDDAVRGSFDYRLMCGALCQGELYRHIYDALPSDTQARLSRMDKPEAKVGLIIQTCRAEATPRDGAGDTYAASVVPSV
ncbi:MAG: hypothetical protein P1U34_08245 [Coxiellaceae bacterium]|nr:hypothetical protein [Coxiellaceae bacterium]